MQVDIKSLFYELLSANEQVFDFIQEYEINGLCVVRDETEEVWLDKKLIKKLNLEDYITSNTINKSSLFDVKSLSALKKAFLTREQKPCALTLTTKPSKDSIICDCVFISIIYKNNQILIVAFGDLVTQIKTSSTHTAKEQYEIARTIEKNTDRLIVDLLNNTKIHLWAFDGETYHYMNKEWFEYTGQDPALPLTIERWTDRVHPDDLPKATEIWLKHFEDKTEHENYFRLKRHDGAYRSFYCKVIPVWDNKGNFLYFQGHNIDITDRIEAEKALKESEERLSLSVEAANIGLWDWYLPTHKITHNENWANIIGYTLKEITPFTDEFFNQLMHPEDMSIFSSHLTANLEGKTSYFECEIRMKHKKGHWVWILDRGKVVERDQDGNPIRMSGTHIDITEQKLADQTIRDNEARLHKLTHNVPGVIYQYEMTPDGKTYFSFMSDGLAKVNDDVNPDKVKSSPESELNAVLHPKDKEDFYKALNDSKEKLTPFNVDYRVIKSNGEIKWHNASSNPEKQNDGTIIWYGILQDITDKIEGKKELERLAHIAENTSDMLVTTDEEGRATWANNIHKRVMGLDPKEIIGKRPTEKLKTSNKHRDKLIRLEEALINHKAFNEILFLYVKDDKPLWVNYNVTPIFNSDGTFLYSIVNKTDVSELIQQQKELKKLLKMSSDQNDRLKEYSYITSHNIRSNVSSILGLTELLLDEPDEILFIEKLQIAANQLDITIRNITALLHLEKDYSIEEKISYNIADGLERIISLNQNLINEQKAFITINQPQQIIFNTVPAYIDSIIQNLLTNALKYGVTDDKKEIIIEVSVDDNTFSLTVKDYGLGMNLNKFGHKLFSLGARFHKIAKGDGLGLYMTHRQVLALNGKIKVESQENVGSSFLVELPI